MKLTKAVDSKHHIEVSTKSVVGFPTDTTIRVMKNNGTEIDVDKEPVILFRGRDRLAIPLLQMYKKLCADDGATQYQLDLVDLMIGKFEKFKAENPQAMKQPGVTLGK